jgi:hypothetical protein
LGAGTHSSNVSALYTWRHSAPRWSSRRNTVCMISRYLQWPKWHSGQSGSGKVNINRDVAAVVKWTANRGSGEVDSNVAFSASNVCVSAGMPTASKKKRKKERNKKIQTHARPRHANAAEYSHDQIGTNDPHPYTANSDIGQATAMDSRKTKQKKKTKKNDNDTFPHHTSC